MNTNTNKTACALAHKIRKETGCSLSEAFKAAYAQTPTKTTNKAVASQKKALIKPESEKTSWTADEINQLFSDKTAELLQKGYIIDLAGMQGHQGEIGKVTFKKDGRYYGLILEQEGMYENGWYIYNNKLVLRFGEYMEEVKEYHSLRDRTFWIDKFGTSWSQEFVRIADNYYVTVEKALEANHKWSERCHKHDTEIEALGIKYNKVLLPLVQKHKGYKGIKLNNIVQVTRITSWNSFQKAWEKRFYRVTLDKKDKWGRNTYIDIHC